MVNGGLKANYVLVHGGMERGVFWDKIIPLLRKAGHKVFAPALAAPQSSTLDSHVDEVCSLIEKESLNNVILCGHSAGGLVITGVADKMPERIMRLVYLDSAVPENGKSLCQLIELRGISLEQYGLEQLEHLRPFCDPLYFDAQENKKIPKIYVHCKQSMFIRVTRHAFASVILNAETDNWDYFILDTEHVCMVSQPQETFQILLRASQ